MLIRRGERYRAYFTREQLTRLEAWNDALRFLWNLAHEQRLAMGRRCKVDRCWITAFDQINELTELRAMLPWLADVPRDVCAQLLVELDKAWQCFFKGIADRPRFKSKARGDHAAIIAPQEFRIEGHGRNGTIVFPKLGRVRVIIHRPVLGRAKTCAIVRDGDQWFVAVSCEAEVASPLPSTKPPIALDVGIAKLIADSDGGFVENPKHAEAMQTRMARAQRTLARRVIGSNNREKAKRKVARLYRKIRRQREHTLHVASKHYAKNHGVVIVEDLKIQSMMKSAKGTVEAPGINVAQKRGLNRQISRAAWGKLKRMIEYKVEPEGGRLLKVPAPYSSQECAECHHIDAASRPSQAVFACTACNHTDNADTNAARVQLHRGLAILAVEPTVTVCGGRSRPVKQKLRAVRRGTSLKAG